MWSLSFPPPRPVSPPRASKNSPPLNQLIYCAFWFRDREPPSLTMSIKIFSYHPCNNTWNLVTSMPGLSECHVLKDFAMVSLGDSLYIIGGRSFTKQRAHQAFMDDDDDDEVVVATVRRYGLRSGEWSSCAPMGTPRYDFACTVCGGKIYVAGGKASIASPTGLASAEAYDPVLDTWSPLPSMRTCRYKCSGVTWNGKVHVIGGFALKTGCHAKPLCFAPERSSAEVFDGQKGEWDLAVGMWKLDVPPNQIMALDDGRLLSSGDCLKVWKGHIESYDLEQNIWNEVEGSSLESLNWPISDFDCGTDNRSLVQQLYLTIAPVGPFLYIFAGYQVGGETPRTKSVVHRFDTSATSNAWVSFEPIVEEGLKVFCSHCCVAQI